MVIKDNKNPHLCYNAWTTRKPTDIAMNQVTLVMQEAPITFGKVKIQLYWHPQHKNQLSLGYNSTCNGWYKGMLLICPNSPWFERSIWFHCWQLLQLSHGHGFWFHYFSIKLGTLPMGDRNAVRSLWQSTWSCHYAQKIFGYDWLGWLDPNTPITPAVACKINNVIVSADWVKKNLCACIYVDDALLLGHSKLQILMKLAALIEAIFVVMGKPDTTVRQCSLAMDKWEELIVWPVQTIMSLIINTYKLTVGISDTYVRVLHMESVAPSSTVPPRSCKGYHIPWRHTSPNRVKGGVGSVRQCSDHCVG